MTLASVLILLLVAFRFLLLITVLLSWILPPYHPVRSALDNIFEPILQPIRNILPQAGGMDFSPIVLFFLIYILEAFIRPFA